MVVIKKILISSLCVAGMVQAVPQSDAVSEVIEDIAWPVAFDNVCKLYNTMNARLGWLLATYYKADPSFRCNQDEVSLILTNNGCSKGLAGLVNKLLWFIEFKKLDNYNNAINAEVKCLARFVTGS